ncbi:hypothetical protein [Microbacterium sp. Mcb102]|uniref:hypothetical protein n=2 Tax=unclassified Microbacterium TaxID=2609290 RepID=UPI0021C64CF3|nr:hypothetical protein [Microbacterium sp. Mcb102]
MSEPQQPPAHLPADPQYPGTHTFPTHASSAPPSTPAAPAAPTHPTAAPAHPTAYPTAAAAYPAGASGQPAAAAYPAGASGQPASWPAAAAAPAAPAGSALGRTAFVIAVITLAVNLISSIVRLLIYTSNFGYGSAYAIDEAIGVISFFAYLVALVLGIIAARRPGPRLLAGVAIGIAGAGALGMIFSWVGIAFLRFV